MTKMVGTALLLAAIAAAGCKGETKEVDRPETLAKITQCEKNLRAKEDYANSLNDRIDVLEGGTGTTPPPVVDDGAAIVVNIEGEIMKITGKSKGPNTKEPGDKKGNAKDEELYNAFVKAVRKSRGKIKKCYQGALKRNSRLSTATISLKIRVNYKTSGSVKSASFAPNVGAQFTQCMNNVAKSWSIPAMPKAISFNYTQTLTPE